MLGGSCRACKSPLLIAATAAELAAFSGIVEPGVLRAAGAI
jgi:hypothetical protein